LIRDDYMCQSCLKNNKIKKADVVHHIKELEDYPELGLTLSNLESLCHKCHNKHHKTGSKEQTEINIKYTEVGENPEIV